MGNLGKRTEGFVEEVGGKVKKGVGHLIGNEKMELEGRAKELAGQARQETAKAGERTKGKLEEVAGSMKHGVGKVLGSERMQVEGKVEELKGEARQKANRP